MVTSRLFDWLRIRLLLRLLLLQVVLFEIIWIARVVGKCLFTMIARSRSRSRDLTPRMLLKMMEIVSGVDLSSVKPVPDGSSGVGDQFASGAGVCSIIIIISDNRPLY